MRMFFSGIASGKEAAMLAEAGVTADYMLTDTSDWRNTPSRGIALDSGAYRAWKKGAPLGVEEWMEQAREADRFRSPQWFTMPDVFGDPDETLARWEALWARRHELLDSFPIDHVVPVWQWGAPRAHLNLMLKKAIEDREMGIGPELVAIGGCVPWMRAKDKAQLAELQGICAEHGTYLHILGLNWLEAMDVLAPLCASCDTSKWLDGARYGIVIHDRNGKLVAETKRVCRRGTDRESLCIESAESLHRALNLGLRTSAPSATRKVRDYTLKLGDSAPRYNGTGVIRTLATLHSVHEIKKQAEVNKENYLAELEYRRRK